ncbi:MAG: hypothetical protein AAF648_07430 [Pseudomonadota bacterium]
MKSNALQRLLLCLFCALGGPFAAAAQVSLDTAAHNSLGLATPANIDRFALSVELKSVEAQGHNNAYIRQARSVDVSYSISKALNAELSLCVAREVRELRNNEVHCSPLREIYAGWFDDDTHQLRFGRAEVATAHWMPSGLMFLRATPKLRTLGMTPTAIDSNALRFDWRPTLPNLTFEALQVTRSLTSERPVLQTLITNDGVQDTFRPQFQLVVTLCNASTLERAGIKVDPNTFRCHSNQVGYAGYTTINGEIRGGLAAGETKAHHDSLDDRFRPKAGRFWMTLRGRVDQWNQLTERDESDADNTRVRTVEVLLVRL